jgi:hypothetical protein
MMEGRRVARLLTGAAAVVGALLFFGPAQGAWANGPAVAILGYEHEAGWGQDVVTKVEASGYFSSVGFFNVGFNRGSTPSLENLAPYDALMVPSDGASADNASIWK